MAEKRDPFKDPVDRSWDSGTPKRPLDEGWNRKLAGEGIPANMNPRSVIDAVYADDSRAFGKSAKEVVWDRCLFWRDHEPTRETPLLSALLEEAGLTTKQDAWSHKRLGALMPSDVAAEDFVDVKYSNDEIEHDVPASGVRDWRTVVGYRRSHRKPFEKKLLAENRAMREFLRALHEDLSTVTRKMGRRTTAEKVKEFMDELEKRG